MNVLLILIIFMISPPAAAINPVEFDNPHHGERYSKLINELRCLVCQNQNLADSNADLAVDLKNIVQQKIRAGETDQQILDFMTERYGDFVLYRPPFKSSTLLLWLGPAIFLLLGLIIVVNYIKRNKSQSFKPTEQQRAQVRKLLDE